MEDEVYIFSDDDNAHWAQGYIHPDVDQQELVKRGWTPPPDSNAVDQSRDEFIRLWNNAVDVFQQYHRGFKYNEGNRPGISAIRQDMRKDGRFMECYEQILHMTQQKMDWISSIFRAEAREIERHYEERMKEIALLREEEKRKEMAEIEALPTFGMF